MNSTGIDRRRALALTGLAWIAGAPSAGAQRPRTTSENSAADDTPNERRRLPPDTTTHHTLDLPRRTLRFTATAGAIRLTDAKGAPRVELAFVAFQLEGAERARRPVTFGFN